MAAVGVGAKPGLDIGQGGCEAGQIRFLRQIADCGTGLGEAIPGVRLDQPGGMRSKVDFPEPLRPTSQIRSPAATASSAPESSGAGMAKQEL